MLICKQPIPSACLFSFVFVYDLCQMSSELRYGIYCRVCGKNLCSYRFFIILSNGDNFVFTKSLLHLATFCVLTQSCLTLCDLVDCSPPGSSIRGIPQVREWVAIPFSRRSSWSRDWTRISCIVGRFFTIWATREALYIIKASSKLSTSILYFFNKNI